MTDEELVAEFGKLTPDEQRAALAKLNAIHNGQPETPFWWSPECKAHLTGMMNHIYFFTGDDPDDFCANLVDRCRALRVAAEAAQR